MFPSYIRGVAVPGESSVWDVNNCEGGFKAGFGQFCLPEPYLNKWIASLAWLILKDLLLKAPVNKPSLSKSIIA